MVDESVYKERFVFLGWVDTEKIPRICKYANVGINVDLKCVETLTGARNRINEMMKFGLPIITTLGSEISNEVAKNNCGIGVLNGDSEELADAICKIYNGDLSEYAENGKKYIEKNCNYNLLMKPLVEWVEDAGFAPDRGACVGLGKFGLLKGGITYFFKNGIIRSFKKMYQRLFK